MSVEPDQDTPHSAEPEATGSADSGGVAGDGAAPPYGWYYFGPEPAWSQLGANQGGPYGMESRDAGPPRVITAPPAALRRPTGRRELTMLISKKRSTGCLAAT